MNISGADVRTAVDAQRMFENIAVAYAKSALHSDLFHGNQERDNVGEEARKFPAAMRDQATIAANAFAAAAHRAAQHVAIIDDTLGSRPALAGTQAGGYADPTAR